MIEQQIIKQRLQKVSGKKKKLNDTSLPGQGYRICSVLMVTEIDVKKQILRHVEIIRS